MAGSRFTYAIGDIHGRDDLFGQMLQQIDLHAAGKAYRLILLGDLIDRGPDSAGVLRRARALLQKNPGSVVVLRGNHEDMMARACAPGARIDTVACWIANGGGATLASFGVKDPCRLPPDVVQWVSTLPTVCSDSLRVYVHAGLDPGSVWDDQSDTDRMWIRERFLDVDHDFGRHVVHGHTPMLPDRPGEESVPDERPFRTNVDTGAVFGGPLTAAVFDHADPRPLAFLQVAEGSEPVVLGARRSLQAWLGLDEAGDQPVGIRIDGGAGRSDRLRAWGRPVVAASLAALIAGGSTGWGSSGRHETPPVPATPSSMGAGFSAASSEPSARARTRPAQEAPRDTVAPAIPASGPEDARAPSATEASAAVQATLSPAPPAAPAEPLEAGTPPRPAAIPTHPPPARIPEAPARQLAAVSLPVEPHGPPVETVPLRERMPAQPQDVFVAEPPADLSPVAVPSRPQAPPPAVEPETEGPFAPPTGAEAFPPVDPALIIAGLTAGLPAVDQPWFPPAAAPIDVEARIREQTRKIPEPAPAAAVLASILPAGPTTEPDEPRRPDVVPLPPRPIRAEKPPATARAAEPGGPGVLRARARPAPARRSPARTVQPLAQKPAVVAAIPPPLCRDGRPPSGFEPGVGWICIRSTPRAPASSGGVSGFFGEGSPADRTGSIGGFTASSDPVGASASAGPSSGGAASAGGNGAAGAGAAAGSPGGGGQGAGGGAASGGGSGSSGGAGTGGSAGGEPAAGGSSGGGSAGGGPAGDGSAGGGTGGSAGDGPTGGGSGPGGGAAGGDSAGGGGPGNAGGNDGGNGGANGSSGEGAGNSGGTASGN